MRVRIYFAKTEAMRFTGHLDLFRTWERTIRRAALPLAYTQGYRPGPRLNLAAALPLGFTSECEIIDMWLDEEMESQVIKTCLERAAPPGITIQAVESVDPRGPSLQSMMEISEYILTLHEPLADVSQRVDSLLSTDSLIRHWREKDYDLRSLIHALQIIEDNMSEYQRIRVQLTAREGATGRPEEVIQALGGNPLTTRIHRSQLIFKNEPVS